MPYALASGWFPAHSTDARGIFRYLLEHGARLLGVTRTYARTVYGDADGSRAGSGLRARHLAVPRGQRPARPARPEPLRHVGRRNDGGYLYLGRGGVGAAGKGAYDRSMFMPPNTGANASYLETLHELLIHERRGSLGAPAGLDLAFSTPRAWLADGQEIDVRAAPTSFGKVTYSLVRHGSTIEGRLVLPAGAHCRLRLRLPAGEHLVRVLVGSIRSPSTAQGRSTSAVAGARSRCTRQSRTNPRGLGRSPQLP